MTTICWRPEVNALTAPQSYFVRYIAKDTLGYDELAAEMVRDNPVWDVEQVKAMLIARDKTVMQQLVKGNQVTLKGAFSYHLSFNARLDDPDDTPPPVEKMLRVKVSASRSFVRAVRQQARLERLPQVEKLPLISTVRDSLLNLKDVLNPAGALLLTGEHLAFDRQQENGECVIEGTESGRAVQTRLLQVEEEEIMLLPDIPPQAHPWNNEYRISVTVRYTEHGSPRTGIYRRLLRTPLAVPGLGDPSPPETGILTDDNDTPYVGVNGGTVTADERLRIQVIQDLQEEELRFSLLDMTEGGAAGDEVTVKENGEYILPGFSGSAVSTLEITVNDYTELEDMIRESYGGRLVDVLDVRLGS